MKILRSPSGCPWAREQTFTSIAPYTIEEAYEVKQAIHDNDMDALKVELGDLLFQVVFHSEIAKAQRAFTIDDVCNSLVDKMVFRHPHVFSDADRPNWEDQKALERKGGHLDGVALALPALMRSQKLQKRAAGAGFDWPDIDGVMAKLDEEIAEYQDAESLEAAAEELGDLLFTIVNLCRHRGVDAESALRAANDKFEARFRFVEKSFDNLQDASLEEMETAWQKAKLAMG